MEVNISRPKALSEFLYIKICLVLLCIDQAIYAIPRVVVDWSWNLTLELKAMFDLESRDRKKTTQTNLPINKTSIQKQREGKTMNLLEMLIYNFHRPNYW
jgi:hypothetical protein